MKKRVPIIIVFCLVLLLLFNTSTTNTEILIELKTSNLPVPVLTYHLVSDNIFSKMKSLYARPSEFDNQLKWIIENGYTPIFADELSSNNFEKPIIITFDDGYIDNYNVVFKLIKKYKVKITIFVVTNMINSKHHLTSDQIKEMSASGLVSIQSHTVSHKNLTKLSNSELNTELDKSRRKIYELTGKYPTAIAYPYGKVNSQVIKSVKKYYSFGFSLSDGNLSNEKNKLKISRYGVARKTTIEDIQKYLEKYT